MPIFRVKSVKIYTGQKKLHENSRGFRDKYEVCIWNSHLCAGRCLLFKPRFESCFSQTLREKVVFKSNTMFFFVINQSQNWNL